MDHIEKRVSHEKRAFDMIRLLRKNGKMKAAAIASALEVTNHRTIYRYKCIIKKLGYNIKTAGGFKGGYYIDEERLTEDEFIQLNKSEIDKDLIDKIKRINDRI
jgi:predicted DNA-binding transcriptional regulator YafY